MKNVCTFSKFLILSLVILSCQPKESSSNNLSTYKYTTVDNEALYLDVYKPSNDAKKSPVLIYVHGGGFASGKRNSKKIKKFANVISANGITVISISYRLTRKYKTFNCSTSSTDKIKTIDAASEDVQNAINYILKHANSLNVDTDKMVISGESAGAEAILNLIYNRTTSTLPEDFKFAGIISKAGALLSLTNITKDSGVPMQLFHSTEDTKVPYSIGSHHNCNKSDAGYLEMYGSRSIASHLKTINKPYHLISLKGGTHGMSELPRHFFSQKVLDFFNHYVLNNSKKQFEETHIAK